MGGTRFIAGDPLRGIACLLVVGWHFLVNAADLTGQPGISFEFRKELGALGPVLEHSWIAVWFFFVLSGYLIGGPFVRAVVRGDGRRPELRGYVRNRVLRIVPGYYFWLIVTVLVVGISSISAGELLRYLTFTHVYDQGPFTERFVQAWTLDVEIVFYALVPLALLPLAALLAGRGTPARRAAIVLLGLAAVTLASLAIGRLGPRDGWIVPGAQWAFAPGVALATLEPFVRERVAGRPGGVRLAWALLAAGVIAFLVAAYANLGTRGDNVLSIVASTAVLAGPLVLQWSTGRTWRLFDLGVFRWVGVRSYGIYLSHVLVLYLLRDHTRTASSVAEALLISLPIVAVLVLVAGELSWRLVERPFLERRAPWRPRPAPAGAPALAPTK